MADDVSGQEAFAAALSGAPEPVVDTGPGDVGGQDPGQGGQPDPSHAGGEGQGQQLPAGAEGGQANEQRQAREEAMVPSWRLREIQEQREADRQAAAKYQRENEQYRRWIEHQQAEQERQKQEAALKQEDFYAGDPQQFIDKRLDHRLQQIVGPIQSTFERMQAQLAQETQERSRYFADQQHGREKVQAAYQRAMQALQAGDPYAQALNARITQSRDPWGDIMAFDRRQSLYETTGGDLDAYTNKRLDEALKDPAFLQRALEAARSQATPVQTGVPGRGQPAQQPRGGMPSLNRATGGADDAGESDDPNAVFREALSAVRR